MNNTPNCFRTLLLGLLVSAAFLACSKNNDPAAGHFTTSVSFMAGTGAVNFPVGGVAQQNVGSTSTTLITGQYADTSVRKGNISIRVIGGDTTRQYRTPNVLVTFTDSTGAVWTNSSDTTNAVTFYQFNKTAGSEVHGTFSCIVTNPQGTRLLLDNGNFTAPYAY